MRIRLPRVVAALAAAALCTGALTACSHGSGGVASDPLHVTDMRSADGQHEVLLRPGGRVTGLVVYMHGFGGGADDLVHSTGLFPLRDQLLRAGYAIVASDAHGDNFGNPASVRDQLAAVRDAERRIGAVHRVDIVAFSMGGLDALLTASSHDVPDLHAVALLSPVVDQASFMTGSYAARVAAAFGNPTGAQVQRDIRRSDPLAQPVRSYAGYAYHFWHSPNDTTVPAVQSSRMCAYLVQAGIPAAVTPLTGNHGDLDALDPGAVLDLFRRPVPAALTSTPPEGQP